MYYLIDLVLPTGLDIKIGNKRILNGSVVMGPYSLSVPKIVCGIGGSMIHATCILVFFFVLWFSSFLTFKYVTLKFSI